MATIFGGSRLANLREKKSINQDNNFKKEQPLKLELFEEKNQKSSYEPSISLSNNNRTHTRLLKGRIERPSGQSTQNFYPKMESKISEPGSEGSRPSLYLGQSQQLKLVINDEPKVQQKKSNIDINPLRTTQKRILIAKDPERQSSVNKIIEKPKEQPVVVANPVVVDVQPEKPIVTNNQQKPIRQQQVQQSMQNENDLIMCTEGCGRKFHRKALEKHAKACKLVFMSKRKQFNSEAKRLVNKQQANIAKQVKAKEKREGRSKGFQKTGENWKSASQDFRAAIKAIKKQTAQEDKPEQQNNEQGEQKQLKIIPCQFCSKPFAEVFLQKHMQNCLKKKQSQKKKPNIPKKK